MEPSSDNRETTFVGPGAGRTRRFFGVPGVCLAVILAVGGCTDTAAEGDPPGLPTATAPDEAETTPAEPTPADEAKAALEAYLDFRDEAYRTAEVDPDALSDVATGDEHLWLQGFVHESIRNVGVEYRGTYVHTLQRPTQWADGFRIIDCEDSSGVTVLFEGEDVGPDLGPDGQPLPDVIAVEYSVVQDGEEWKVSNSNYLVEASC